MEAIAGSNVIVAGSNAPAEDCYQAERTIKNNELIENHRKHIDLLYGNGSEIILNETQSHMDEIETICEYCQDNKIPFIVSLFFTNELRILSGELLTDVVNDILQYSPLSIGFNCIFYNMFHRYVENNSPDYPWGFYLNCGAGKLTDKGISCGVNEKDYVNLIEKHITPNTNVVGSCCGSSPDHTKELRRTIDEIC